MPTTATKPTPRRRRKTRLADVAKAAAVSPATVSRFLSNPSRVSPEKRNRIELAVSELRYIPDAAARALVTERSMTIGAVVPTLDLGSFAVGVEALQERIDSEGYMPLLALSNFNRDLEARHVANLIQRGVDGIVLVGLDHDPGTYAILEDSGIPFVNTWNYDPDSSYPCVGFDNRAASRRITEHLLSLGHRRIAMIAGGMEHANDRARARLLGFRDALRTSEIPIQNGRVVEVGYSLDSGRAGLRELMAHPEPPTAIVCGTDLFAFGAILECVHLGHSVPQDVSITGFDNLPMAARFAPSLTTVHTPAREMGLRAADYLLASLKGGSVLRHLELEANLIVRASTAEPKQDA